MRLGWVDFSKEDREKVLNVMHLLQEKGAVDEIGIGIVRDAFSNLFFPGTSTIQTIAKYFLIVPYVLKEVCDDTSWKNLKRGLQLIDKKERECGRKLLDSCGSEDEKAGIIGRNALPERWVARKPSNIYWSGIRTYGICTRKLTISELLRVALNHRRTDAHPDQSDNPDDRNAGRDASPQLISVPEDFNRDWRSGLSTALTKTEAAFLRAKITESTPDSLLSFILKNNIEIDIYTSFEALYEGLKYKLPPQTAALMKLACDFNRLVYAARVRYNFILGNEDASEKWEEIDRDKDRMMSVDIEEVLIRLNIANVSLRNFLIDFKTRVLDNKLDEADRILEKREREIKTEARAKLSDKGRYDGKEWIGGEYLDYRFFSARRIINDIYAGEKNVQGK